MDYAQPMNYLIVINNNQLKIVSDGKKSIMDLHSNKMMNQMQDMLTACMVGDLSNMSPGYALEYFEDAHYYLIQIKPVSKAIQAYINQIQIYLDKKRHVCPQTTFIGNRNQLYRIRIFGQEIQFFER